MMNSDVLLLFAHLYKSDSARFFHTVVLGYALCYETSVITVVHIENHCV